MGVMSRVGEMFPLHWWEGAEKSEGVPAAAARAPLPPLPRTYPTKNNGESGRGLSRLWSFNKKVWGGNPKNSAIAAANSNQKNS